MKRIRSVFDGYLVPIELAGYVLVLDAVADRAPGRARARIAAAQPLPYQRLHLLVGELVAQLHRRVARYGGQDPLLPAHPGRRTPHRRDRFPETPCHVPALGQGGDHPVYPERVLAERLDVEAVDGGLPGRIDPPPVPPARRGGAPPVYPERGLAERLDVEAVDGELLERIDRLRCIPGRSLTTSG